MRTHRTRTIASTAFVATLALTGVACGEDTDPSQEVSEGVEEIGDAVEDASEGISEEIDQNTDG